MPTKPMSKPELPAQSPKEEWIQKPLNLFPEEITAKVTPKPLPLHQSTREIRREEENYESAAEDIGYRK